MKIEASTSLKQQALNAYYANPNVCLYCGEVIKVKQSERPSNVRRKKFCNKSCAGSYNNIHFPKRAPSATSGKCQLCGEDFDFTRNANNGKYNKARYCPDCRINAGIRTKGGGKLPEERTKKELYDQSPVSLWARASITRLSRDRYIKANLPMICFHCGYDKHVQICHKRAIADFPGSALIREINALDNLIALCRNCHWELDNGFLKI